MKLFGNSTTPYGRKVCIVAELLGLRDQIEILTTNPYSEDLRQHNPLGRVPTLLTDDGALIYDSYVICVYLSKLAKNNKLLPKGAKEVLALQRHALADGILVAGVNIRQNMMRNSQDGVTPLDDKYMQRQYAAIKAAIAEVEKNIKTYAPKTLDVAAINLLCALDFISFRFKDIDWQKSAPKLAKWRKSMDSLDVIKNTYPKE